MPTGPLAHQISSLATLLPLFLPEIEEIIETGLDLKEPYRTEGHSVLHTP